MKKHTVCALLALAAVVPLAGCGGGSAGDRLGLGLSSIGQDPPAPIPSVTLVPLARYAGTWRGPWKDPVATTADPALGQTGMLTLQVAADGQVSGQITDAATGQTGVISAQLEIQDGQTTGYLTNQACTLNGQTNTSTSSAPADSSGHWRGEFLVPILPAEVAAYVGAGIPGGPVTVIPAGYDLTKQ